MRSWYPDPWDPSRLRFFDGASWTGEVRPFDPRPGWSRDPWDPASIRFHDGSAWTSHITRAVDGLPVFSPGPASWYPDPYQQAQVRWFDGNAWTAFVHGPPPSPSPTDVGTPVRADKWTYLSLLGGFIVSLVVAFIAMVGSTLGNTTDSAFVEIPATLALGAVLVSVCVREYRRSGSTSFSEAFFTKRPKPGVIAQGIGLGFATKIMGFFGMVTAMLLAASHEGDEIDRVGFVSKDMSPVSLACMGILVCLIVPFYEELYFRGVVAATMIARHGVQVGIVFQALIFSGVHISGGPPQMIAVFPAGLVMGWMWHRHRSLWGNVALHVTFNVLAFAAGLALVYLL